MELIVLHIPKTAGSALRSLLNKVYGRECVATAGIDFQVSGDTIRLRDIPNGTKVLTGHITYKQARELHVQTGARLVTFLREPTERYLSHYYHLKRINVRNSGFIPKLQAHVPLTIHMAIRRYHNVISKYLSGLPLNQLDFIGFTENFEADIAALGQLLDWPEEKYVGWASEANSNVEFPASQRRVSPRMIALAGLLNKTDLRRYAEAKRLTQANRE